MPKEEEYSSKGMSVQQNYTLTAYFHVHHFSTSFQTGYIALFFLYRYLSIITRNSLIITSRHNSNSFIAGLYVWELTKSCCHKVGWRNMPEAGQWLLPMLAITQETLQSKIATRCTVKFHHCFQIS